MFTVRGELGSDYRLRGISYRRASYDPMLVTLYEAHVSLDECVAWLDQCVEEQLVTDAIAWPIADSIPADRRTFLSRPARLLRLAMMLREHAAISLIVGSTGQRLEAAEALDAKGFNRILLRLDATSAAGAVVFDYLFNGCRGLRF